MKSRAPAYLSIDFWSGQSKELIKNKLYVPSRGKGRFVIFSEKRFTKPYLELQIDETVMDIDFELPDDKTITNH